MTISILIKILNKLRSKKSLAWEGNFQFWEQALKSSRGYGDESILNQVRKAALAVKSGEAAFERDAVPFEKIQHNWPLTCALLKIILEKQPEGIEIIDFGGSLGSTFQQVRTEIDDRFIQSWNVVEQDHFVNCGQKEFETEKLKFYHSMEEVLSEIPRVDIVLLSSVLQYLPEPYQFLERVVNMNFEYIILDRTAFFYGPEDRLTIQSNSGKLVYSSYPHWFLDRPRIQKIFTPKYDAILSFESYCDPKKVLVGRSEVGWEGMVLKERNPLGGNV